MKNIFSISWNPNVNLKQLLSKNFLVLTSIFIIISVNFLLSANTNNSACQESVANYLIKNKTESFELTNKDIYINPEIQNVLCIIK